MAWHRVPTVSASKLRATYGDGYNDISQRRDISVVGEQWFPATERVVGNVTDRSGSRSVVLRFRGDALLASGCRCEATEHCDHILALICAVSGKVLPIAEVTTSEEARNEWRVAVRLLSRDSTTAVASQVPETPTAVALFVAFSATDDLLAAPAIPGPYGQGEWTLTGVKWQDFAPSAPLGRFDPAQQVLLNGLYRLAERPVGWMSLSDVGPQLWPLLAAARAAGLHLFDAASTHSGIVMPRGVVQVHDDLEIVAAASDGRHSGDAADIHFTVHYEQTTVHGQQLRLLGPRDAAHGIYWADTGTLHIGRLDQSPPPTLARLLERGEPIVVPRPHLSEFTSGPMTELGVPVLDPHNVLATITVEGPKAVLHIAPAPQVFADDEATFLISWSVRYWLDGESHDASASTVDADSFRDQAVEEDLWQRLLPCLHAVASYTERADTSRLSAQQLLRQQRVDADVVAPIVGEVLPTFTDIDDLIIDIDDQVPEFRPADVAPVVRFGAAAEGLGRDWLNLQITVEIGDDRIPIDTLIRDLATDADHIVLPSGVYITADLPEISRLARLIHEARAVNELSDDGKVPVDTANATLWQEILECGEVDDDIAEWAGSKKTLALTSRPERLPVPATVHAQLRDYQRDGFDWLAFLIANNTGGILADDMGLGKTLQLLSAMAHTLHSQPHARFLVIAPTSVVGNWAAEADKFVPSMPVAAVRSKVKPGDNPMRRRIEAATLVVTTYALVRLDPSTYADQVWTMVVADEAQAIKNDAAKTHKAIRSLSAPTKIAATGTPIENDLMDLASLLSITIPALFPDRPTFVSHYRTPIVKEQDADRLAELKRRVRPFLLRRTKEEVLQELPSKQAQVVLIDLSSKHRTIYDRRLNLERQKSLELLADDPKHARFQMLAALTRLRQLSLHPGLVDEAALAVGSAKVDYLTTQLPQLSEEGHRSLVFSSFPTFLRLLRPQLEDVGLRVCYLAGELSPGERAEQIDMFTRGDADVFLISLKAGGSGLNLTQADYVFLTDPWWNPAAEDQAIDRAHRIGQTRPVNVIRLVAVDSIEGKVVDLQSTKRHLAQAALGGEQSFAAALTDDDIRSLLM
ncbi:putative helicase [Gordonia otitidis NBRC 100426]|uniref:Helicase n=2 Tax=Gordonia otitidis TaxID=249058 RepID=H5TSC5_GORO1|nr:putative helicase [Gordonia otitidis NBRC 100426]